jgi:hypothetical protein
MAANWDSAMQERFDRLERNVETLGRKVDALDAKVDVLVEQLREDIEKLGEGYEAGLQGISRQIADIDGNWDYKWSPHDLAIRGREARLKRIERK